MSDAPERIWATEDAANLGEDKFHTTRPMQGLTEYIRADLLAELVEAAEGLHHAMCGDTGFVAAVRADSGLAYPWPALDAAEERLTTVLAKIKEQQA